MMQSSVIFLQKKVMVSNQQNKPARKERRRVQTYHLVIKSLYDDGKVDENDIPRLNKLKDDIMDDYANGIISEQHYNNLNNKISVLYEEIYKKKIDLLNDKDTSVQNHIDCKTQIFQD